MPNRQWLAIAIGNTRIQAAVFQGDNIEARHACRYDELPDFVQTLTAFDFEHIAIASVVPELHTPWHDRPQAIAISKAQIPITGIYATMGIDRVLAIYGAGSVYGYPCLVIDAGTALTLTGAKRGSDGTPTLVGGAILPGLSTQLHSLHARTAALPQVKLPDHLPPPWATDTPTAMQSGVVRCTVFGLEAFVRDWRSQFPDGQILLTGGDAEKLSRWGLSGTVDSNLIFWGMRAVLRNSPS